ncbi:MAG: cell division protein FtsZ, partial [Pseudophaeobacter sp.]
MTLNLSMPGQEELAPKITVFGVGGAGGNAVNNMIAKELEGVDFVVANTDAQALQKSAPKS